MREKSPAFAAIQAPAKEILWLARGFDAEDEVCALLQQLAQAVENSGESFGAAMEEVDEERRGIFRDDDDNVICPDTREPVNA